LPGPQRPTPTDKSKSKNYKAYKIFDMSENSDKFMGYSTFRHFMQNSVKFLPITEPGKPCADHSYWGKWGDYLHVDRDEGEQLQIIYYSHGQPAARGPHAAL
jgi:hypothetical protein